MLIFWGCASKPPVGMVSKNEYNELLAKLAGCKCTENLELESLLDERTPASKELGDTVDPFQSTSVKGKGSLKTIEEQIKFLRKAREQVALKQYDSALNKAKTLKVSPFEQVVVRAKYLSGEILFLQGNYDMAMQAYENIIFEHAFSGVVLKALDRLVVCYDKLKLQAEKSQVEKLEAKRNKYYSMLHDIFKGKI